MEGALASGNHIESDLVKVPAYRRLLAGELDKKAPCGTVEWRQGAVWYQITNDLNGNESQALPESERPAEGTKAELRWCDWIAGPLAKTKQTPPFSPFALGNPA